MTVQNCGKKKEEEQEEGVGRKGGSDSEFVTPGAASRKKRKLFTNTPQNSQMFTPPTDSEMTESPHSVVKRQLKARRSKKM